MRSAGMWTSIKILRVSLRLAGRSAHVYAADPGATTANRDFKRACTGGHPED